jgi:integrase
MICVQCIFKPGTYDDDFHRLEGQIDGYARSLPGLVRTEKYLSPDGGVIKAHLLLRRPEVRRPPRPVSRRIEKPGARCPPRTAPCHRHRTSPPGHPLSPDDIRQLLAHIDRTTVKGTRDASLILLGFASALRRSELAALTAADIESKPAGLLIDVRRSKGAPEARGQVVGVARPIRGHRSDRGTRRLARPARHRARGRCSPTGNRSRKAATDRREPPRNRVGSCRT